MTSIATTLLPPGRTPYGTDPPWVEPFGRGVVARGSQDTGIDRADTITAVADSGGVIGISVGRRPRGNPAAVLLHAVPEDELIPLASGLASALRASEAYGRVAIGLWVSLPRGGHFTDQAIASVPRRTRVSRELTVPAGDDEVKALAMSWHRELQRTVGITKYEQEPTTTSDPARPTMGLRRTETADVTGPVRLDKRRAACSSGARCVSQTAVCETTAGGVREGVSTNRTVIATLSAAQRL